MKSADIKSKTPFERPKKIKEEIKKLKKMQKGEKLQMQSGTNSARLKGTSGTMQLKVQKSIKQIANLITLL